MNKAAIEWLFVVLEKQEKATISKLRIFLAAKLRLDVIAEGVETAEQRDFLELCGCRYVQGYLYGKPMAVPDLEDFIQQKYQVN